MLCRALAHDCDARMLLVKPSDIHDMWVGESEKRARGLFVSKIMGDYSRNLTCRLGTCLPSRSLRCFHRRGRRNIQGEGRLRLAFELAQGCCTFGNRFEISFDDAE